MINKTSHIFVVTSAASKTFIPPHHFHPPNYFPYGPSSAVHSTSNRGPYETQDPTNKFWVQNHSNNIIIYKTVTSRKDEHLGNVTDQSLPEASITDSTDTNLNEFLVKKGLHLEDLVQRSFHMLSSEFEYLLTYRFWRWHC